jgi:hypothetical protein
MHPLIATVLAAAAPAYAPPPLLVSQTPAGTAGNGISGVFGVALSGDGRSVAFSSSATDLVPADTGASPDIYVRRVDAGMTVLASSTASGQPGNALSTRPSISLHGDRVAFLSAATNFDPADPTQGVDAYLKDLTTGAIRLVPAPVAGRRADGPASAVALSGNGRSVAFVSRAADLDPRDADAGPDVYVERRPGQVTLASLPAAGPKPVASLVDGVAISRGGRFVAFSTDAPLDPRDGNGRADVYVKDLRTGRLTLASATQAGVVGDQPSTDPVLTARGEAVVFASSATDLDPQDTETDSDVYRKDLWSGRLSLVSTNAAGVKGDDSSAYPSVSGDGRYVAFASYATNLDPKPPGAWAMDVYVKDLATGVVSNVSGPAPAEPTGVISLYPALSLRGRRVAFVTNGGHLSAADTNNLADVYLASRR